MKHLHLVVYAGLRAGGELGRSPARWRPAYRGVRAAFKEHVAVLRGILDAAPLETERKERGKLKR
jgi:hypothetical protein